MIAGGACLAITAVLRARLPAVRGAGPAAQAPGPAPALLALLRAPVPVGRAAADLHGLRRLHDGRAVRLRGAPGHRAVPRQLPRQHALRPVHGPRRGALGRAARHDGRVCRARRASSSPMAASTGWAGAWWWQPRSTSSTTCSSRSPSRSRPTSRRSPTRATSRPPRPWRSPSTTSPRCSCPRRSAISGSPRPARCSCLAAGMAATSFCLALMIPRHPAPGYETVFATGLAAPAE